MWLWLVWTAVVLALVVAGGWAVRDTLTGTDLLRRHDPRSAAAVDVLGEAWNPATLPMRDRAFDPPPDSPRYRTGI